MNRRYECYVFTFLNSKGLYTDIILFYDHNKRRTIVEIFHVYGKQIQIYKIIYYFNGGYVFKKVSFHFSR